MAMDSDCLMMTYLIEHIVQRCLLKAQIRAGNSEISALSML
jgi:hypothetical protein